MTHKKVIIFNGPPGSGKDAAVNAVHALLKGYSSKDKMAEPIKRGVHALFGLGVDWNYYDFPDTQKDKDTPLAALLGMSPRQAYIWMSEECLKPKFGPAVFGELALTRMKVNRHATAHLFSDGGFVSEWLPVVDFVSPQSVLLVEIHATRDGKCLDFVGDSRSYIGAELTQARPGVTFKKLYNTIDPKDLHERQMFKHLACAMVYSFLGLEMP